MRTLSILCSRDTPFPAFGPLADAVEAGGGPDVAAGIARWFQPAEIAADGRAVHFARDALAAARARPEDWARALRAIAAYDRAAATPRLTMPVFLLAQSRDGVSTPAAMEELARRLPRSVLQVGTGAHMSPFADPAQLARLLAGHVAAPPVGPVTDPHIGHVADPQ